MIEVRGVTKSYGDATVLDEVSFDIGHGIVALAGPNGVGKTTLLQILCGLVKPDRGEVSIGGFDVATQSVDVKRLLGFQPEHPALHPALRPRELYAAVAAARGLAWSDIVDTARRFGAEDLLGKACGDMSQGQKRLVTLVAAIAHRPRVLLLDEPTNALDPHRVAELKRYLTSSEAPETTLISTHQLDFVTTISERSLLLSEGRLVGSGTIEELRVRFDLQTAALEEIVLIATRPR